jgi:hypothetical protein
MTSALEGGEWSAARPGRTLPPGKTRYQLYRGLGGSQGRYGQVRKISPPPGFDLRTVQPVVSRYNDWATRPTFRIIHMWIQTSLLQWPIPSPPKILTFPSETPCILYYHKLVLLQPFCSTVVKKLCTSKEKKAMLNMWKRKIWRKSLEVSGGAVTETQN